MSNILQSRVTRFTNKPGELLTMDDGTQWFHAYTGSAPVQITSKNRSGLRA